MLVPFVPMDDGRAAKRYVAAATLSFFLAGCSVIVAFTIRDPGFFTASALDDAHRHDKIRGEVCTFCYGGGPPALFAHDPRWPTCYGLANYFAATGPDDVFLATDPECTVAQSNAFLYCGCPEPPPLRWRECGNCADDDRWYDVKSRGGFDALNYGIDEDCILDQIVSNLYCKCDRDFHWGGGTCPVCPNGLAEPERAIGGGDVFGGGGSCRDAITDVELAVQPTPAGPLCEAYSKGVQAFQNATGCRCAE